MNKLPAEFLVQVLSAATPQAVQACVAVLLKAGARMLPIGGKPATSWDTYGFPNFSDDWNNRHKVNLVVNPDVALMERVRNGDDTIIELFEQYGLFSEPLPTTYDEAASQVQQYLDAHKFAPPVALIAMEASDGTRTATVVDAGLGVRADLFNTTLMATGSAHKLSNPLVAGNLGIGGQPSVGFAKFTVIVSRLKSDPNIIAVTIAHREDKMVGEKDCSYVWYCTPEGHAFTIDARDCDLSRFVEPQSFNNSNVDDSLDRPFLPPHGTVVRLIGYPLGPNTRTWHAMRNIGFGIPIKHTLVNGLRRQKGLDDDEIEEEDEETTSRKRVFYPVGLRTTLNNRIDAHRLANPVLIYQKPVEITIDSRNAMTIAFWLMDTSKKPKSGKVKSPLKSLFGEHNSGGGTGGVVVSITGQCHVRLPDKLLLDKAGLSYLDGHLMIEVRLDNMSIQRRNDWLIASREMLAEDAQETIRKHLLPFLRDDDRLKAWNKAFGARSLKEMTPDQGMIIAQLNEHFALTGLDSGQFGGAHIENTITLGARKPMKVKEKEEELEPDEDDEPAPFEPRDPPTFIAIRKNTIEPGEDEWCTIITDAADRYGDRIRLVVEDRTYLKTRRSNSQLQTRKGLYEGKDSVLVHCVENCPLGTLLPVHAALTLDDGTVLISPTRQIKATIRPRDKGKKKTYVERVVSQPKINPVMINPNEITWVHMHADDIDATQVAFNYLNADQTFNCYINTQFTPFKLMSDRLKSEDNSAIMIDAFREAYQTACVAQTMADIAIEAHGWEAKAKHEHRSASILSKLVLWHVNVKPHLTAATKKRRAM